MKRLIGLASILLLLGAACFAQSAGVDFRKDEILCGSGEGGAFSTGYYAAKVLKAASADTKNQAQVLYVSNGNKEWVSFVIPSHKAKKEELVVGAAAFYPVGWEEYDDISLEDYRQGQWGLGHITSLDDMFKNLVEIDGAKYNWKFVRAPDTPSALEPKNE